MPNDLDPERFTLRHATQARHDFAQIIGELDVAATKVVHPGEPGQAVGCKTHGHEREAARMNVHKNARLTAARSTLVGETDHAAGLDGAAGGARRWSANLGPKITGNSGEAG
jgi:hypothetical protein